MVNPRESWDRFKALVSYGANFQKAGLAVIARGAAYCRNGACSQWSESDFLSQLGSGLWQLFDKPSAVWQTASTEGGEVQGLVADNGGCHAFPFSSVKLLFATMDTWVVGCLVARRGAACEPGSVVSSGHCGNGYCLTENDYGSMISSASGLHCNQNTG
jgi:hypothetical protein